MAKFYKVFKNEVVQWFHLVVNNITTPEMWQEVTISMIPKEEHSCPNVKNFRPISLLNSDYKIFAKVIAERLKNFFFFTFKYWLKKISNKSIGEDQAHFLLGRLIRDNIRTVLNILEYGDKLLGSRSVFLRCRKRFRQRELVVYGEKLWK